MQETHPPLRPALVAGLLAWLACTPASDGLVVVGTVERTSVELVAPVSEVIVRIPVERGQRVAAGTLLVQLDTTLAEADVAQAEANLAGARTGERVAVADVARAIELRRGNFASQQDLERAELARDEAAARLREARARLEAAHKRKSDLTLSAPVPGVVDQLPYEVGERVPAGAVVAVLLADEEPWVRVWIPERSAALLAPGTAADIQIDGIPRILSGSVLEVAHEASFTPHYALTERDRVHLVYETRIGITDAPFGLRPGLPARVTIRPGGVAGPTRMEAPADDAPSPSVQPGDGP